MALALALAQSAERLTQPNPRVGCVITDPDGSILGQGHTQRAGGPHAEVMALQDAAARNHRVVGATAYVTLEPCSHQGRTGPCCDALVQAGIRRVVASLPDPNPLVAGNGFARLRAAGVEVEVGPGAHEARELNLGFFSRMVRKTPWVRMKIAASLDGRTALANGESQWITSAAARADGHASRARACAVLTGIGTILKDKPTLDARLVDTPRQPHVIVVDSRLETPPLSSIFIAGRAVYICAGVQNDEKQAALEAAGATVLMLPGADGRVDLAAMVRELARREINEIHVEAGQTLNGALVQAGLVDEFLVYMAPKLIGPGMDMAQLSPLTDLQDALTLDFTSVSQVGPDVRIAARVRGRDQF
ncbi:MAG: bifunctional diaminohydroxyphosphoribosylaminopyrimidine deaminase/5-amino-6-(5-phosphoribosylamino)uracil reductase RibD [Burkholderiales bacterium]|nr:bifunctional diaminohydroxyphosphoribosylaminopyrimidine deaminase/5-amino-6-(5-phosphoribosylamino)uracil reductase RibD [Burkholderiales bacterium]